MELLVKAEVSVVVMGVIVWARDPHTVKGLAKISDMFWYWNFLEPDPGAATELAVAERTCRASRDG